MFAVTLICVGKLKEKFYLAASEEYAKRLRGYVDFTLIELPETRLPDDPSPAQIAQGLAKEAELIRARIPKGAWFCVLTPEGTQLSSEELAAALARREALRVCPGAELPLSQALPDSQGAQARRPSARRFPELRRPSAAAILFPARRQHRRGRTEARFPRSLLSNSPGDPECCSPERSPDFPP